MRLYAYYRSSASYRVRIALALKGVEYEYVPVNIAPSVADQSAASYGEINPLRQVPVLEWHDADARLQRLTQSVAIIEYLEERWPSPALLARDALVRARQREVAEIINAGIQPLHNSKTLAVLRTAGGPELEASFRHEVIERGLRVLERLAQAQTGPFFEGGAPSIADVFIVPQIYAAKRFSVEVPAGSRLSEIEAYANTQDAFYQAHPDRQPDAPKPERSTP